MTYPLLNTVNATADLSQLLVYANTITDGFFVPMIVAAFWFILFIGGALIQFRFTGRMRPEMNFTAASFATFGLSVILSQTNGLLNPIYLIISLVLTILGGIWIYFAED